LIINDAKNLRFETLLFIIRNIVFVSFILKGFSGETVCSSTPKQYC